MGSEGLSKDRFLRVYFVIAYAIPAIATVLVTLGSGLQTGLVTHRVSGLALVVMMSMIHSPTIAAVTVVLCERGPKGVGSLFGQLGCWRFRTRWYLLALLSFPLSVLVSRLLLPVFSHGGSLALSWSVFPLATLLSALWEEIGWTGYATARMLKRFSPLKTAVLLGVIHTFWHLAADFWGSSAFFGTPARYVAHFLLWLGGLVLLRVVIVWIYTRTRSVVLGWLAHFGYTGAQLLFTVNLTATETLLWNSIFVVVLLLVVAFLVTAKGAFRRSWRGESAAA